LDLQDLQDPLLLDHEEVPDHQDPLDMGDLAVNRVLAVYQVFRL